MDEATNKLTQRNITVFAENLENEMSSAAAVETRSQKQKALNDFNTALSALKTSTAENQHDAQKTVRQKSHEVDKLERQEKKDAMKELRGQRRSERDHVRKTYQEVN